MKIGSLFSGAGGLDMAVEHMFGAQTVWHCENNPAASKVLAHRWPGVPNHHDITTTDWTTVEPVDVVCGGWPCQPFSQAGKRLGAADERALWPHVAGAVRLLQPRWVVLENVSAVLAAGEFQRVADDLASLGYDFGWVCVRASDVGAPHRRERVFILAHTGCGGLQGAWSRWDEPQQSEHDSHRRSATDTSRDRCHRGEDINSVAVQASAATEPGHTDRRGLETGSRARRDGITNGTDTETVPQHAADSSGDGRDGSGGDDLVTLAVKADRDHQWGKYAPAMQRWEHIVGPAPKPTEPNSRGNPRLNPAFSEWMMGWPAGWVTQVPGITRNDQLRIIGNGVCPQQAGQALRYLQAVEREVCPPQTTASPALSADATSGKPPTG